MLHSAKVGVLLFEVSWVPNDVAAADVSGEGVVVSMHVNWSEFVVRHLFAKKQNCFEREVIFHKVYNVGLPHPFLQTILATGPSKICIGNV